MTEQMDITNKNLNISSSKIKEMEDIDKLVDFENELGVEIKFLELIPDKKESTQKYLDLQKILKTQIANRLVSLKRKYSTQITDLKDEMLFIRKEYRLAAPTNFDKTIKKWEEIKGKK
jgi:molybdenum cofactor biosynthesis enzyme MoaA